MLAAVRYANALGMQHVEECGKERKLTSNCADYIRYRYTTFACIQNRVKTACFPVRIQECLTPQHTAGWGIKRESMLQPARHGVANISDTCRTAKCLGDFPHQT